MEIRSELASNDKMLHCIARMIQSGEIGEDVHCLYCKYASACQKEFEESGNILFCDIMEKLQMLTYVQLFISPESVSKDLLCALWIKKYPELYREFYKMSFEQQRDRITSPDILKYE